jgi:hypothetical protein
MTLAVLIEGRELIETVIASVVAGIGVTTAFSVAIWGFGRFIELSGGERPLATAGAATVAVLGLACVGAALVFGIVVMTGN